MFAVGSDATTGQRPPETKGACGLVALHPLGRAVTGRAVLEAEDQPGSFVVPEKFVVAEIRQEHAGHGRRLGEAVDDPPRQFERLARPRRRDPRRPGSSGPEPCWRCPGRPPARGRQRSPRAAAWPAARAACRAPGPRRTWPRRPARTCRAGPWGPLGRAARGIGHSSTTRSARPRCTAPRPPPRPGTALDDAASGPEAAAAPSPAARSRPSPVPGTGRRPSLGPAPRRSLPVTRPWASCPAAEGQSSAFAGIPSRARPPNRPRPSLSCRATRTMLSSGRYPSRYGRASASSAGVRRVT